MTQIREMQPSPYQQMWRERMAVSAEMDGSPTSFAVDGAVRRGLVPNTPEGRAQFIVESADVMSHFVPPNGNELRRGDLGTDELAGHLGGEPSRVEQVVDVLSKSGLILEQRGRPQSL